MVCIDRLTPNWTGDTVTIDNMQGAYHAASYLIGIGHRDLAAITGPLHLTNAKERLSRFKRALRHAGIESPPGYQQETTFYLAGGYSKVDNVKAERRRFAIGDDAAPGGAFVSLSSAQVLPPTNERIGTSGS